MQEGSDVVEGTGPSNVDLLFYAGLQIYIQVEDCSETGKLHS